MDGGSLCQPHAATITPAAMMDGGEGKEGGDGEGEIQRGASITPLNLPVTAEARMEEGGWGCGGGCRFYLDCWSKVCFLYTEFVSSFFVFLGELGL